MPADAKEDTSALDALLESIEALRATGSAYYRLSQYSEALQCYSDALARYPSPLPKGVEPPLVLLTNRAAALMSLGDYSAAIRDMQTALGYPNTDTEANVKRLSRLLRCYLALGKLESSEVTDAVTHTTNQLVMLRFQQQQSEGSQKISGSEAEKITKGARKALDDIKAAQALLAQVHAAREKAEWQTALDHLQDLRLLCLPSHTGRELREWEMMRGEALAMLARLDEAKAVLQPFLELPLAMTQTSPSPQHRLVITSLVAAWATRPERDAASLWMSGIFFFAKGDLTSTMVVLDTLRVRVELPSQASYILSLHPFDRRLTSACAQTTLSQSLQRQQPPRPG